MTSSMRNGEFQGSVGHFECFGQGPDDLLVSAVLLLACGLSSSKLFTTDIIVLQSSYARCFPLHLPGLVKIVAKTFHSQSVN